MQANKAMSRVTRAILDLDSLPNDSDSDSDSDTLTYVGSLIDDEEEILLSDLLDLPGDEETTTEPVPPLKKKNVTFNAENAEDQ
jgi:hypothetical protein